MSDITPEMLAVAAKLLAGMNEQERSKLLAKGLHSQTNNPLAKAIDAAFTKVITEKGKSNTGKDVIRGKVGAYTLTKYNGPKVYVTTEKGKWGFSLAGMAEEIAEFFQALGLKVVPIQEEKPATETPKTAQPVIKKAAKQEVTPLV